MPSSRWFKVAAGAATLVGLSVGGAVLATQGVTSAQTSGDPVTGVLEQAEDAVGGATSTVEDALSQETGSTDAQDAAQALDSDSADKAERNGPHTAGDCTEEPLSGDTAEKVRAAALQAVPSATVDRLETDCDSGAPYEAHMTKEDGSRVTVFVNDAFEVTEVQEGGGPGHARGPRPDGMDRPNDDASSQEDA